MSVAKSKQSPNTSNTSRKWLIILAVFLLISLGFLQQSKANPKLSLRLRTSKYRKYADWIDAMSKYESDNYTNTLSKKYNNIFSMGYPSVRPAKNIGSTPLDGAGDQEPDLFSAYSSRDQAIEDLLLWMDYKEIPNNIGTVESFVAALKDKKYFAQDEKTYLEGVKKWL